MSFPQFNDAITKIKLKFNLFIHFSEQRHEKKNYLNKMWRVQYSTWFGFVMLIGVILMTITCTTAKSSEVFENADSKGDGKLYYCKNYNNNKTLGKASHIINADSVIRYSE